MSMKKLTNQLVCVQLQDIEMDERKVISEKILTDADLSYASYEAARIQIRTKSEFLYNLILEVPIWEAELAIDIMGKYRDCNLEVKRSLRNDEWKLKASDFDNDYIIWSPGA